MRSPFLFPILGKRYSLDVSTNEDSGIQLTPLCCSFFYGLCVLSFGEDAFLDRYLTSEVDLRMAECRDGDVDKRAVLPQSDDTCAPLASYLNAWSLERRGSWRNRPSFAINVVIDF